jgi:hypothetical protein
MVFPTGFKIDTLSATSRMEHTTVVLMDTLQAQLLRYELVSILVLDLPCSTLMSRLLVAQPSQLRLDCLTLFAKT